MVATRWSVITGAPSSGKTTVIEELRRRGYCCVPEVARAHIDAQLAKGMTIAQMRSDEASFQRALIKAKLATEEQLKPGEVVFMDRAMPDSISYFRLKGIDASEIIALSKKFRYERVFLFNRLPFKEDDARVEDEASAAFLDRQLERDYSSLGYDVIRVAALSVEERVSFLLHYCHSSLDSTKLV